MKTENKRKLIILSFILIISLQLFLIIKTFAFDKTGEHSDEVWSYGLANSHNKPYIFSNNERTQNICVNKWITGRELNDYVTVQKGERFDYANVISNLKYDEHPPLYFMILHTICSFFPDTYSRWFAFPINIICFIVTMVFLLLLIKKATGSIIIGLFGVLYFGFCTGGVSLYIFNRHYAMAAMLFLMLVYFHFRLFETENEKDFKKSLIPISVISAIGMLTLYLSALASCILAALVVFRLLGQKKFRKMFMYASVMLASTVPMFILGGIFSKKMAVDGYTYNTLSERLSAKNTTYSKLLEKNIGDLMNSLFTDFLGLERPTQLYYHFKVFLATLAFLLLIALPLLIFLYKNGKISVKQAAGRVKTGLGKIRHMSDFTYLKLSMFILVIAYLVIVLFVTLFKTMGVLANRYVFAIYPIILFALILAFYKIIKVLAGLAGKICRRKSPLAVCEIVTIVIGSVWLFASAARGTQNYLFPRIENDPTLEEITEDRDVALFLSEDWLLTCYADILNKAGDIYVGRAFDGGSFETLREGGNTPRYIIVDVSGKYYVLKKLQIFRNQGKVDEVELRQKVEDKYPDALKEEVKNGTLKYTMTDLIFGRTIYLYEYIPGKTE